MPGGGPNPARQDQGQQVPAHRQAVAGPDCGSSQQEARLEVLPAEGGALSQVNTSSGRRGGRRQMLVVPVQDPDLRTPLQELPVVSRRLSGLPS